MPEDREDQPRDTGFGIDISDDDIYDAMSKVAGYIDITTEDFREVYRLAFQHALQRLVGDVRARNIMVRDVVSVRADTPWDEVARVMAGRAVKSVPVVDNDHKVLGIVSQSDFLRHFAMATFMEFIVKYLEQPGNLKHTLHELHADDVMTAPAITFHEDAGFMKMIATFKEQRIDRIPVVDDAGRLVGMVSRKDFVQSCSLETV